MRRKNLIYVDLLMNDIVDKQTRSRMMSRIRGKDTKPELLVRSYLHRRGFRFKLHPKNLPGKPDIVLPKYHAVILVHGCFWHRHTDCKFAYNPKTRQEFWQEKFNRNVERDEEVRQALQDAGWRVLVVWECGLGKNKIREKGLESVAEWIKSGWPTAEYPTAPIYTS